MNYSDLLEITHSCHKIGSGSSRDVYKIDDTKIVKVPRGLGTILFEDVYETPDLETFLPGLHKNVCCAQMYTEFFLYTRAILYKEYLCPILDFGITHNGIPYSIMPEAITMKQFSKNICQFCNCRATCKKKDIDADSIFCPIMEMEDDCDDDYDTLLRLCAMTNTSYIEMNNAAQFFHSEWNIEDVDLMGAPDNIGLVNGRLVFLDYGAMGD